MDLTGKRILVTGASSGIGRGTAVLLSQLGATVTVSGRDEKRLNETLESLEGTGHTATVFDFSQEGILPWFQTAAAAGGPFNGLVHAAGVSTSVSIRAVSEQRIESIMRTNFTSAMMISRGFCARAAHVKPASIVFVSSVMAVVGSPALSLYAASKGALVSMTKSLATELAPNGIRVNCVAAGYVPTPLWDEFRAKLLPEQFTIESKHPLGAGSPYDVGCAIGFLLSDASRWITGTNLMVDGGYTAQ